MKKIIAALPLITLMALPFIASAHEHQIFEINGIKYEFTVGSVGEPVVVDDKSGVTLSVRRAGVLEGHEEHHEGVDSDAAVTGLEETLKVELIAGNTRKTLDLLPAWNAPGSYSAPFFPTEAVQLSYRVFGTIDSIPFDATFVCAAEHDMSGAETDTTRTEISPGVVRVEQRGAFSCPREKAEMGFPASSASVRDVNEGGTTALGVAIGSGIMSLAALALAWRRRP